PPYVIPSCPTRRSSDLSGQLALQRLAGGSSAISPEAHAVRKAATQVAESAERSVALFGEKTAALSELSAVTAECAEPDWDGHGADRKSTRLNSSHEWIS